MSAKLSSALFREVRPDFFRVLSGPLARLYVDALDALEAEASQRSQALDREEALAIIEAVIESSGEVEMEADDPIAEASTIREKARVLLDTLRKTGWVEEEERTDWQKRIHFEPNGVLLMQALRKIAFPEAATFSDKIVNVCFTLANRDAFADQPWAQVESCIASLRAGLGELRGMQKSIERHTRRQLAATSLKENLIVLFDQFAETIGRACYAELVHARLPSKLAEARRAIGDVGVNLHVLELMQTEVMRREPSSAPEAAMAKVRLHLNELGELLEQVEPLADAIDRRTAEFARRSQARFRYLQETTSENRARVQTFFESLNRHFAGRRIAEIDEQGIEFPELLVHDVRLMGGMESLYVPRVRAVAGEIDPLSADDDRQRDKALAQLEGTMRDSLTVSRANHFVSRLNIERGRQIASSDLLRDHVHNDEDVADLIACLLHARSADAAFELHVPRRENELDAVEFDSKLGYRIERFALSRKK